MSNVNKNDLDIIINILNNYGNNMTKNVKNMSNITKEDIMNRLKDISIEDLYNMKTNQPESLRQNIDKLIQIKESMKQNNGNKPKPKNNGNNKKKCKALPKFDPESNKRKKELLDLLIKMNGNLFGNRQAGKIITALLKVMDDEQKTLKERQKLISECLNHYNEILENYYDQSIKIDNLEKIAQSLGLSKNKPSPQQVVYKA